MKRVLAVVAVLAAASTVHASDPIGIYAVIEKIAYEPSAQAPERVRIWGTFALAERTGGMNCSSPQSGQLYFKLPKQQPQDAIAEWRDLEKSIASGEPIGFGNRYAQIDREIAVLKADDLKTAAEEYALGFGLSRMRRASQNPAVRGLMSLPRLVAPANGAELDVGAVTLSIERRAALKDSTLMYVFELTLPTGERLSSPPVAASGQRAIWTPSIPLAAGAKYLWKAWAVQSHASEKAGTTGEWTGPAAAGGFSTKAAK